MIAISKWFIDVSGEDLMLKAARTEQYTLNLVPIYTYLLMLPMKSLRKKNSQNEWSEHIFNLNIAIFTNDHTGEHHSAEKKYCIYKKSDEKL
jgi:hypothetical protein